MRIVLTVITSFALIGSAFAQSLPDKPVMDLFSDEPFVVPPAPEIQVPGGPPPADVCGIEANYDFAKDKRNPGLHTTDQFRRWAVSGRNLESAADLYFLGLMHEYGFNAYKSEKRAKELYQKAARLNYGPAHARLGKLSCQAEYYCTAARAFWEGAQLGDYEARMGLSRMYRWNLGVYFDPIEAYRWAHLGMEKTKGNWIVANPVGESYLRSIDRILNDGELEQAEELINDWKTGFDSSRVVCKLDY